MYAAEGGAQVGEVAGDGAECFGAVAERLHACLDSQEVLLRVAEGTGHGFDDAFGTELDAQTLEVEVYGGPEVVEVAAHVVDILSDAVDFGEIAFPFLEAEGVVDLRLVVVREPFAFGDGGAD